MNAPDAHVGRPERRSGRRRFEGSPESGCPAPAVLISFPFEGAPTVTAAWATDADDARMVAWLDAHPEFERLIFAAVDLSEETA